MTASLLYPPALCSRTSRERCVGDVARRLITLMTLVTFLVGNIGWSAAPVRAALTPAQAQPCGCGHQGKSCGCCCRQNPKVKGSCCGQRPATAAKKAPAPAEGLAFGACPCDESPATGFTVLTQPRLIGAAAQAADVDRGREFEPLPSLLPGGRTLAPELPPPKSDA
jgi:hypothetical protein